MMEGSSLESRSSEGVRAGTGWGPAGERMGAESGLEGPAGKPLRDLGEGEERSGAVQRSGGGTAAGGAERLRKGSEATCGPLNSDLVAVL